MEEKARRLYLTMPGAPKPKLTSFGEPDWSEVEGNEYFAFCLAVAQMATEIAGEEIAANEHWKNN